MSSSSTELFQVKSTESSSSNQEAPSKPAWGGAGINQVNCGDPCNNFGTGTSFKDLMSQEMAKDLQLREEEDASRALLKQTEPSEFKLGAVTDTNNDLFLAQMLQYQFDREFDDQLQREEKHMNKNCKLAVSYDKYKVCPSWYGSDSDGEDEAELEDENRVIDSFEERKRDDPVIPPCGYIRHNNKIVTKHDKDISGRKNAERFMNLPPEFNTGDGGSFDMQLSNKVYNKLMTTVIGDTRRKQRTHDKEEKATAVMAMDPKTRLLIYKMVNNSTLESVSGIISTGKESAVIHALGGVLEEEPLPTECAIKVFKTYLTDFKTRERYIRDDYRFKDRMSKNNNRLTIQLWAEKEFSNLKRLQKAKIPSPTPILIKNNILLMSFIGENQRAAPKLKQVRLPYEDWCIAYEQVEEAMITMFKGCRLVHADLSAYNILWHDEKCWIIDLAQAVAYTHCNALRFLLRDCSNVIGFFSSRGLTELPSVAQLFKKITGIDIPEEQDVDTLIDVEVSQMMLKESSFQSSDDHFEFLWKEIQKEESVTPFVMPDDCEEDDESEDASVRVSSTSPKARAAHSKRKGQRPAKTPEEDLDSSLSSAAGAHGAKGSKERKIKQKGKRRIPNI